MDNYKHNNGITLMGLTIYITVILIILGVMAGIRGIFFKNMDSIKAVSKYSYSFDKFNSFFLEDVKSNSNVKISNTGSDYYITFGNGITYVYNSSDKGIYRNKIKISENVSTFQASSKTIVINNVQKQVVSVTIVIGDTNNNLLSKNIDYVLKYW